MTKALKHTDGRIIAINFGELKWSNKTSDDYAHEREGNIQATMYQNAAQALRDQAGTLTEWERVQTKNFNFAEVMSLLTMTNEMHKFFTEELWRLNKTQEDYANDSNLQAELYTNYVKTIS